MLKFLTLLMLSLLGMGEAACAATTDNFFADSVLSDKWTVASGNAASKITVIPTIGLLLQASAGNGGSDLASSTNFNAPMVLQALDPASNWTLTVSVVFGDCVCNAAAAGVILATQPGGFSSTSQFLRIFERARTSTINGLVSNTFGSTQKVTNLTANAVLLRIQRAGSTYTTSYSVNGRSFTVAATFTDTRTFTYVGLEAVRQPYDNRTTLDEQAIFTDFELFP